VINALLLAVSEEQLRSNLRGESLPREIFFDWVLIDIPTDVREIPSGSHCMARLERVELSLEVTDFLRTLSM
jgi:hypothetical protein